MHPEGQHSLTSISYIREGAIVPKELMRNKLQIKNPHQNQCIRRRAIGGLEQLPGKHHTD